MPRERFTDRVKAEITTTELGHVRAELATADDRAERLDRAQPGEGTFALVKPQDLPGRLCQEGQVIGYVLPPGSRIVRATVRQDDIDLVRHRLRRASVKLAERLDETRARADRPRGAGGARRPSQQGPGRDAAAAPFRVDPRDPHGTKTLQRVFQLDIELLSDRRRRPHSAAAPTCASTMNGSRWASRSGGACGSSCCPAFMRRHHV